jgi:hypothetical protein
LQKRTKKPLLLKHLAGIGTRANGPKFLRLFFKKKRLLATHGQRQQRLPSDKTVNLPPSLRPATATVYLFLDKVTLKTRAASYIRLTAVTFSLNLPGLKLSTWLVPLLAAPKPPGFKAI